MSLPIRERGLKYICNLCLIPLLASLPVRERGLKLAKYDFKSPHIQSLPTRERGLKSEPGGSVERHLVAPNAGAWIEVKPPK